MGERANTPQLVRDRDQRPLELERLLGSGGQGRVYAIRNSSYAVKLCDDESQGPEAMEALAQRLRRVSWLPLEDLPISRPVLPLTEPHVGYVMRLLDDMIAMNTLTDRPKHADLLDWYAAGGGLRRRLRLLASCAQTIAMLHGRGVVYGDISPGNVFVPESISYDRAWLIDADNLAVESDAVSRAVKTPYFAAPEILRRASGNTPFTDAFSFAILAYTVLTTEHPLFGDMVANGPVELEDDAQRGLLPWAGHLRDDRNRSTYGLPVTTTLTWRLHEACARTFEQGMQDPIRRPDLGCWTRSLQMAADITVACQSCSYSYYAYQQTCLRCGAGRAPVVVATVLDRCFVCNIRAWTATRQTGPSSMCTPG